MNKQTKFALIFVLVLVIGVIFSNFASSGEKLPVNIAIVNVQEVVQKYEKVNILKEEQKNKMIELQKFVENANKEIAQESDTEKKKKLEAKYNKELQDKKHEITEEYKKKLIDINKKVSNTIKKVAKSKNFDIVLVKTSVLYGGKDITDDILKNLK